MTYLRSVSQVPNSWQGSTCAALHRQRLLQPGGSLQVLAALLTVGWGLQVRLDVWHFMRRLAKGCTSESHPLYGTFMARLSLAVFEWDKDDYEELDRAKRMEMIQAGIAEPSQEGL